MNYYNQLNRLMCQDLGGRGLLSRLPTPDLGAVSRTLIDAKRVIVLTGFPVRLKDGFHICGETDGPSGSANIAASLTFLGCDVWVVTDEPSSPLMQAALLSRAPKANLVIMPKNKPEEFAGQMIEKVNPTHIISLERPGKAMDGHFHNMRGEIIDDMVTDTDQFLSLGKSQGIITISIGDGGNELGMGAYSKQIKDHVPCGELICARESALYTLTSGVSNWWGWGIASLLSCVSGFMLLPSCQEETSLLQAVVDAGAVDGCTKEQEMTVDSLSLDTHLELLMAVRRLTVKAMKGSACYDMDQEKTYLMSAV